MHPTTWVPSPSVPQSMPPPMPGMTTFPVGVGHPIPDITQSALLRGPYLRFGGYDPITHAYRASVLVVIQEQEYPGGSWATDEPTLAYMQGTSGQPGSARAFLLYRYKSACFYRFDIHLNLRDVAEVLDYTITHQTAYPYQKRSQFQLPAIGQTWRWGFHSCNGFEHPEDEPLYGGIQPLWHDVLYCARTPLHVMVGGGDQLYNDGVWAKPALKRWLDIPSKSERQQVGVPPQLLQEAEEWYFTSYLKHWNEPAFSDALATVPQMMVWDDHDIFDGWGSYTEQLMLSPTFQAVFEKARLYYCLFQQHSTPTHIHEQNQVWGEFGWNWIACLGSNTALVVTDSRSERTRNSVMLPATYTMLQQRLAQLPASIKHVVMLTTVPFIYPQIPTVEGSLQFLLGHGVGSKMLKAIINGTGLAGTVNSAFGEPDLLDDLIDHWSAEIHVPEKIAMLHMLQELALARGFRFTFLSGDVHVAGVGRFCTAPPIHPTPEQLLQDHRFMYQVISSAIANKPPPAPVIKALNTSSNPVMIDQYTREKMMSTFQDPIGTSRLKGARNWCLIHELPDGALNFQLRMEEAIKSGTVTAVDVVAPRLYIDVPAVMPALKPFELVHNQVPNLGRTLHAEASMKTTRQHAQYAPSQSDPNAPPYVQPQVAPVYINAAQPAPQPMAYQPSPAPATAPNPHAPTMAAYEQPTAPNANGPSTQAYGMTSAPMGPSGAAGYGPPGAPGFPTPVTQVTSQQYDPALAAYELDPLPNAAAYHVPMAPTGGQCCVHAHIPPQAIPPQAQAPGQGQYPPPGQSNALYPPVSNGPPVPGGGQQPYAYPHVPQ